MAGPCRPCHLFLASPAGGPQGGDDTACLAPRRGSHSPGRSARERGTGTGPRNGGCPPHEGSRGGRECPAPRPAATGPYRDREAGLCASADLLPAGQTSATTAPSRQPASPPATLTGIRRPVPQLTQPAMPRRNRLPDRERMKLSQRRSPLPAPRSPLPAPRSPLTAPRSLLPAHRSPLPAHCSPLTAHRSPLTAHCSPLTTHLKKK